MRKLTIKTVFVAFCAINILAIAILGITIQRRSLDLAQTINLQAVIPESKPEVTSPSYKFDDPFTAYNLLEQLDIFETIKDGEINANYTKKVNGLLPNNHYCEEHRAYFISNPEFLFENIHIITNYWRSNKLRTQVIPMIGKDIHTEISSFRNSRNIDMRLDASMFIMWNLYYGKRQIGKQFSCLSQASNHIPGHDNLYKKDAFNLALVDYIKKYESKPECLDFTKYFPKTWVLKQREQCVSFFEEFKSEKYQQLKKERNIVYFRKIGANVHEGRGVFPINDAEEDKLMKLYKNGTKCGKIKKNYLIQYNVHNLLLINNRKFGFRMFMLVASTNPLLAYFHDGYARLSLNEYDAMSKEVNTFVTNINLNKKASTNLTKQEIEDFTLWLLEDVQEYLLEQGLIDDPNWLDNYLRPEFKKVMVHLLRVSQSGFFRKSSLFCLFGLDFVLDEHLGLWFIETNAKPLISGSTEGSIRVLNQMLVDMIEIVMGLIRSRMKRVINYVNMLTKESLNEKMEIPHIGEKRQEFKQLTMNYFELEFQPSKNNTFQKIVDDRETGVMRYMNLIKEECLSTCDCSS